MDHSEPRLVKAANLDSDELNGELILHKLNPQRVIVLNAAGLALWRGLDLGGTRSGAIELVQEALPHLDPESVARDVGKLIDDLLAGGFLERAE
jgi:hypothetical protein